MKKFKIATMLIALSFLSCSSVNIYHAYNNKTDLTSYKTFDWLSRPHAVVIFEEGDSANKDYAAHTLKEAVKEELNSRGLSQKTDNPDLLISYIISAKVTQKDIPSKNSDGENNLPLRQVSKGNIFLDFKDSRTRESLWKATALNIEIQDSTPEQIKRKLEKTIKEIFKKFPSHPTH